MMRIKAVLRFLPCVALLALMAPAAYAEPRQFVDATGRSVVVEDRSRVVSLGGSLTEIFYALGLADHIAAVDTTSLYPPQALHEKPNIGYLRALSAEGVLSVGPSLILAEDDAGPPEAVALLQSASVPFLRVPSEETAEGAVAKIRFVGEVMGVSPRADALADEVAGNLAALEAEVAAIEQPVRALFILSLAGDRIMAAGEDTSAQAILELAGARNALSGFTGYKPVNAEAVLAAAPDAIVIMARNSEGDGPGLAVEEVLANAALAATPAAQAGRIVAMNGLYLLGFGPRVAHAARDLAAALYPDRELPELAARPLGEQRSSQ